MASGSKIQLLLLMLPSLISLVFLSSPSARICLCISLSFGPSLDAVGETGGGSINVVVAVVCCCCLLLLLLLLFSLLCWCCCCCFGRYTFCSLPNGRKSTCSIKPIPADDYACIPTCGRSGMSRRTLRWCWAHTGAERGSKKGRGDHAPGGTGVRRELTPGQFLRPLPASTLITPFYFFECPKEGCGMVHRVYTARRFQLSTRPPDAF